MLMVAHSMKELSFPKLMEVYAQGNRENGAYSYQGLTPERQQALAEEDFRDYLSQVFFQGEHPVYLILTKEGRYVSALRLEDYEDGVLLEALETAPGQRRKGYASELLRQTINYLQDRGPLRLYSHVAKKNTASMKTHLSCGFRQYLDYARYIDGTVSQNTVTLLLEIF